MSRAGFIVSFDGPGVADGRIDVRDLAPALMSLGRMIDAANVAINGDERPIKVDVRAVSVGRFVVHLDAVLSGWDLVRSVIDRGDVDDAKKLLEWLGLFGATLFAFYRWLRGRSPDRVASLPDNAFRFELDGLSLSIRSLAFQEGNKWRLFDGQNVITATIADADFIARVDRNMVRFAKGDILVCEVRSVQSQSADGLRTEHTVLRVTEHRVAPDQIPLPFTAD